MLAPMTYQLINHSSIQGYRSVCFLQCHICVSRESTLWGCLNIKGLLARNRHDILRISDWNGIQTHNHIVRKQTLNHLANWLSCVVSTYLHGAMIVFLSCHICVLSKYTLYLCLYVCIIYLKSVKFTKVANYIYKIYNR